MKFIVGDKVKALTEPRGMIGTVIEINSGVTEKSILVHFPGFDGHNGPYSKHGPYETNEYCYMIDEELELIQKKQETIVIYRKEQEVIALDEYTGEKAVAKFDTVNEFDFRTGAKLAFDRLMERCKKESLYNGKVVCVEAGANKRLYTVGKIYQFKEGKLTANDGAIIPFSKEIHSFREWQAFTDSKFIEIVED